jgi:hypothetical protein
VALARLKEAKIAPDDPVLQQQRFEAFLATQQKGPVSDAKKEQLYKEYLEWRSSHH